MPNRIKIIIDTENSDTTCVIYEWDTTLKCVHERNGQSYEGSLPVGQLQVGDKICIENHSNPAREITLIENV